MLSRQLISRASLATARATIINRSNTCIATSSTIRYYSSKSHNLKTVSQDEKNTKFEFKIEPLPRVGESIEKKRARLLYQSRKRGILECDLLMSTFAKLYLKEMALDELEEYDKLLDENDWDIYYWATNNNDVRPCPERWEKSPILAKLRDMVKTRGHECTRMPDLY